MRFIHFVFFLLVFCCSYGQTRYQKDFDFYWNTINENFGYFDIQKTNWNKVKAIYQSMADTITTDRSFISFLETVNDELYNGHISLNANLPSSNRLIPTGADIWINYRNKEFIITAVRQAYNAERSGIKRGMRIIKYNDILIDSAIVRFLPKSVSAFDNRMYEYAANMLLAGTHDAKRKITVLSGEGEKTFYPDNEIHQPESGHRSIIEYRVIPSNIGYIWINNSLGNTDLIKAFDKTLDSLWNTNGLIIDLRVTPSGGNTTVARAIMSRFISKEMPYQKHSLPNEEKQYGVNRSWIELVSPRGKTYKKALVILVSRWTGSMGEGIAIGFDGMKRAQIVGDKMAGLLGAIYSYTLPETKIGFSIPVEKLFHINGNPRENFIPGFLESNNEKQLAIALKLLNNKKINSR